MYYKLCNKLYMRHIGVEGDPQLAEIIRNGINYKRLMSCFHLGARRVSARELTDRFHIERRCCSTYFRAVLINEASHLFLQPPPQPTTPSQMVHIICLALSLIPQQLFDAAIERVKKLVDLVEYLIDKVCTMWDRITATFSRSGEYHFIYIY